MDSGLTSLWNRALGRAAPQPPPPGPGLPDEIAARLDELSERADQFREVWDIERAADIMFFCEEGVVTEANEAALRAYGYGSNDFIGLPIVELQPPEFRDELRTILDRRERVTDAYQTLHVRCDGRTFPAEVSFRSTMLSGHFVVLAVVHDLSERTRAERKLADAQRQAGDAARSKAEFIARTNQEILAPLNGLLGMTEVLLDSGLSDEQRGYVARARASGEALLRVVNGLLDFSDIETGKVEIEEIDFDVAECVEAAISLLVPEAQSRHLLLLAFIDPKLPAGLRGDPKLISQILTNLVGNALKFTEQGSVLISVTQEKDEDDDSAVSVRFNVKDTGIGIELEAQGSLFQAFAQPDASERGGTGLGLAICKRLVDLMGGSIGVTSDPAVGSTFWFRVRLPIASREHEPPRTLLGVRALVVDAHEFARSVTARYLAASGATVDQAASSRDALHMMEQRAGEEIPFQVVVVDFDLPDRDALDFSRFVRAIPALAATHLIVTSAFDVPGRGIQAVDAGFAAYIVKPVRQSHLYESVAPLVRADVTKYAAEQADSAETSTSTDTAAGSAPAQAAVAAPPSTTAIVTQHPKRVLLAEDNPINQRLARKQLETLGCDVTVAENGRVAVELARKQSFDLVLMDVQMPDLDGFGATRQIRLDQAGSGVHTLIVAMTAAALPEDRAACLAAGMDDYLAKPVRLDTLQSIFKRWLTPKTPA
jgi:two-component system sensor histidine kinase/response regulator